MPTNTVKYSSFFRLVSYLFHPVAMPLVTVVLYFIISPRYTPTNVEIAIIAAVFIITYIIPIISIFLLLNMKLIASIHLRDIQDRKRPLMILILLNTTLLVRVLNSRDYYELHAFFLAVIITLVIAYTSLFFNKKISLHLMALGGMIGFFISISIFHQQNYLYIITFFVFIAGLVATSRLVDYAHSNKELLSGFIIGLSTQLITFYITIA